MQALGRTRAWAVHGSGMDELSTAGPSEVQEVHRRRHPRLHPRSGRTRPRARARSTNCAAATAPTNAQILTGILDGSVRGAKREIVELNAAAGFVVTGLAPDMRAGLALAREQLDTGRALDKAARAPALQREPPEPGGRSFC